MKKLILGIALALAVSAVPASAADFNGLIVDGRHGQTHAQYLEKLVHLTAGEVLDLQHEGVGVVIDGRYIPLDRAGADMVLDLLSSTDRRTAALWVNLRGELSAGGISVQSVTPRADGFIRN